jgi:hypothetical protein
MAPDARFPKAMELMKSMEEMHGQAAHRLSFDSWLSRNIGNEGSSSSHTEQTDHVIDSYVGLSGDGFHTPKKNLHVPTMVSFCYF